MRFVKLPKTILACPNLSASAKIIYAVILDAGDGCTSSIGYRRIMQQSGIRSADTVRQSIDRLEAARLITVTRGSSGQRCIYHLPESASENGALRENQAHRRSKRSNSRIGALAPRQSKHVETDLARDAARHSAHQQLIDHFTERWASTFAGRYPFDRRKDPPAAKRLLEAVDGHLERARAVVDAYLDRKDPWIRDRGSTLALLASNGQLSRLLARTAPASADPAPVATDHPVIEAARAKWPEAVEAAPTYWTELARRADDARSGLSTTVVKRAIEKSASIETFKATIPVARRRAARA